MESGNIPIEVYTLGRNDFQDLLHRFNELETAISGRSDARTDSRKRKLLVRL
jgi:hypothetical protein